MIRTNIEKLRSAIANICWKIIVWTSAKIPTDSSSLPDLCATDNATDAEQYIDRLNELLVNRSKTVREIAITAPYAGGKSSILKTYMRRFPFHKYTCISLSDFDEAKGKDENEDDTDINKIEKSIVQQILYRTSSESTPNSRFRRIFPKPFSYFDAITQSVTLLIWTALASIPFTSQHWIFSTFESISQDINLFNRELWLASYLVALPLLILKDLIKNLGPITLTKMNVFQAELAFDKAKNDSVFNTYLEEIIYYFSATKSDVVIFEDLDRLC